VRRRRSPWQAQRCDENILHYFLDMGGDSLLAFFEYPKGVSKADRDTLGAMQHVSFVCGPRRYRKCRNG
jgi:hypothetical protein